MFGLKEKKTQKVTIGTPTNSALSFKLLTSFAHARIRDCETLNEFGAAAVRVSRHSS